MVVLVALLLLPRLYDIQAWRHLRLDNGITRVILHNMKTAISIPDELFEFAEQFARRRGLSRSELYTTALRHYLQQHRSEAITEQLNAVYDSEASTLDPAFAHAQSRTLPKDEW